MRIRWTEFEPQGYEDMVADSAIMAPLFMYVHQSKVQSTRSSVSCTLSPLDQLVSAPDHLYLEA